jgi:hypothetical protein
MITDKMIDQAYSDLKATCGGVRNDYFGLLVLEKDYKVPREDAVNQVAFGGNDYGLDGFHFDVERRNLYLLQFKNSPSRDQFKPSFQRLIDTGMERIFLTSHQDPNKNELLASLRSCLLENRALVDQVIFRFIFTGDPEEAEKSQALDKLREDLGNKKYVIDQFFKRSGDRPVTMVVEFRSTTGKVSSPGVEDAHRIYPLHLEDCLTRHGPDGESMHVGFARLKDLWGMYQDMGQRFFERNIRSALPDDEAVNRALTKALRRIVLEDKETPSVFAFNHNGISLAAEQLDQIDGVHYVTAPRLLNGAQTVTTLARFMKSNENNTRLADRRHALDEIRVLCKVITGGSNDFVTAVTINNNRQNPVEPWNLRANDMIQLELQDKFRDELGIYYERQENAFANMGYEEMEDAGITQNKQIQLVKLAQTFAVSDGEIDKLMRMKEVFEDDKIYSNVFHTSRLKADPRHIVLCYKIQFRLRKLLNEIVEKGPSKYEYVTRARNLLWALLCQAVLNDPDLKRKAEFFGQQMSMEVDYTEYLAKLATTKCRALLSDLMKDATYAPKIAEGNYSFLRTNAAWKRCMESAYAHWHWVEKHLK